MKAERRPGRLPPGLEINLTNASNLRCRGGRAPAPGAPGAATLTFSEAAAAIDMYAALVPAGTVTFTGGEPFLEFDLLKELVLYAVRKWPRLGLDAETNGTLLTPGGADFLSGRGVDLWLRFNGLRAAADRDCRLREGGGSVFDSVVKNLAALGPRRLRRICAAAEFSARDIGSLLEGMVFLRRYGFKEMAADLDVYGDWSPKNLQRLRRALREVREHYARELKAGAVGWPQPSRLYGLSFDGRLGAADGYPPAASMSLSADGWFFPCPVADPAAARRLRAGSVRAGLDLPRLDKLYSLLRARLRRRGCADAFLPPAERYFSALAAGRGTAAALAASEAAAAIFKEELGPLMRVEKFLAELARKRSFHGLGTNREFLAKLARLAGGPKFFQDLKAGGLKGGAGGKAAALARLEGAGFPVPPTFVLSVSAVKELFSPVPAGGGLAFAAEPPAEFFSELNALFPAGRPFIVRSSSPEEDGAAASFAGLFESVIVRKTGQAAAAVKKCLRSGRGKAAAAYRRLTGKSAPAEPAMALVFQPFIRAGFGGVALVEGREKIVLELSRGGNAGITGGRTAGFRYTLDLRSRRLERPAGGPLSGPAARRLFSRLASVRDELFPGGSASVEFLLKDGSPLFLQARPLPSGPAEGPVDLAGVYRRISGVMQGLGVGPADWSLAENADLAAFNYLGAARNSGERLEHFRIRLSPPAKERIAARGWVSVKYDQDDDTLFPAELAGKARRLLQGLARHGIFVMFVLPGKGERPPRKTLSFGGRGAGFSLPFSYVFEGIEQEEERALARLAAGEAAAYLGRLAREREIWLEIERRLKAGKSGAYEKKLAAHIPQELALIEKKRRLAAGAAARNSGGTEEIRGVPFKPVDRVITGKAVTYRKVASSREKSFIYFGYDLEPCFLPRIARIAAVVVSRGAFGSHAAQICSELGVPLILETANLGRVKDGDGVSLDLRTGAVRRFPAKI